MLKVLAPGDIVLVTSDGFVSRAIRRFTRLPGEPPTRFSHAEMVVKTGLLSSARVVSADGSGIRERTMDVHVGKPVRIFRPQIPAVEKNMAVTRVQAAVGRPYPYWRLVMHLLDRLLGGAYLFRRVGRSPRNPECAALIAYAYRPHTFLNLEWWAVAPDDLDDHAILAGWPCVYQGRLE